MRQRLPREDLKQRNIELKTCYTGSAATEAQVLLKQGLDFGAVNRPPTTPPLWGRVAGLAEPPPPLGEGELVRQLLRNQELMLSPFPVEDQNQAASTGPQEPAFTTDTGNTGNIPVAPPPPSPSSASYQLLGPEFGPPLTGDPAALRSPAGDTSTQAANTGTGVIRRPKSTGKKSRPTSMSERLNQSFTDLISKVRLRKVPENELPENRQRDFNAENPFLRSFNERMKEWRAPRDITEPESDEGEF